MSTHTDHEVLAWTEGDGPGHAPAPPQWMSGVLAGALGVTLAGVLTSDALCPDHRTWVQGLGSIAILGAGVSLVQVLRRQSSAAWFAAIASLAGIAIGLIDTIHDPERGTLIAIGFAIAAATGAALALRVGRLSRWDRELAVAHVAADELELEPVATGPAAIEPTTAPHRAVLDAEAVRRTE